MKIHFLGTAAAEGWPGMFCACAYCRNAAEIGGKNLRTRFSMHINDSHKIDFPPDTYYHKLRYGLDLAGIKHLFITHSHRDHFACQELQNRRPPFAHIDNDDGLVIYGNDAVKAIIEEEVLHENSGIKFCPAEPFKQITADDIIATPLAADHAGEETAVFYLFYSPDEQKSALVANDTGWFPEETLNHLSGLKLDFVSFDCTNGNIRQRKGHMGVNGVIEMKILMEKRGILNPSARCFATHFSHNGALLHSGLEEVLNPAGIEVAYDGLVVEV